MGVEDNYFQITDLDANTTFYDWVVKENDEIIEKLNLMSIYGASAGSSSIDITIGSTGNSFDAGDLVIDLADVINGVTVSGDLVLNSKLVLQDRTEATTIVTSVNGQTGAVTISNPAGATGAGGPTGPAGESPDPILVSSNNLINGSYDIWQRGTDFSSDSSLYFADRWVRYVGGSNTSSVSGTNIIRKSFIQGQTDVLGSPTYYASVNQTIGGTVGSNDIVSVANRISDFTRFLDETLYIDGYVKGSTAVSGVTAYIRRSPDGDTAASHLEEFSEQIPIGTTWSSFLIEKEVKYRVGNTFTVGITAGLTSGNNFLIDGSTTGVLGITRGFEYTFDLSDPGLTAHPFAISDVLDGTHAGGEEYTVGVTRSGVTAGNTGAFLNLKVVYGAPDDLYYYCKTHSGMATRHLDVLGAGISGSETNGYMDIGFNLIDCSGVSVDFANIRAFTTQGTTLDKSPVREKTNVEEELKKCSEFYQRSYFLNETSGNPTPTDTTYRVTLSSVRFTVDPDTDFYYNFPVEMRTVPAVTLYSPRTGDQDGFNKSADLDMRLTSGTTGYLGEIRLHSSGATALFVARRYTEGLIFKVNSGAVVFDKIFVHYVADADYSL